MTPQVLIVGAGPTGLVLALALEKQGIPFRIIDQQAGPGAASRAMVVHARTLEFYRQFGIADLFVQRGIPMHTAHIMKNGKLKGKINFGDLGEKISPYPYVLSLPQDEHEALLIEKLRSKGIQVEWNTELVSLQEGAEVVHALTTRQGTTQEQSYAYVCGCDGAHSTVRKEMGLEFPGGTYEQMFFVADVGSIEPVSHVAMNFFEEGFCLVFPICTSGQVRLIGLIPPKILKQGVPADLEPLIPYVETNTGVRISQVNWYSTYKSHHRVSEHFRKGRVFIAGDAAHVHSPVGGQGMNTGIGDAMNLGWKLAAVLRDKADTGILDSYESERIAFARSLVATTDRLFQSIVGGGILTSLVTETVIPYIVPLLLDVPKLRKMAFQRLSQTQIRYRDSILSSGASGSIHGGDRLPWIQTARGDNFAPLQSVDWQLHVYGQASQSLRRLSETTGIPLHEMGWTPSMKEAGMHPDSAFLVRPDGYIALADPHQDPGSIQAYLEQFHITPFTS
ncbi:FAD-dependent monooxygenase [Paenibacillus sp. XY044]|uniref:FAD-dependent monooxygenase n=1 Tax=Paenibacillus sp. XY044 TaxID=2026089 RepID=UPI000B99A23C|nr:FAD-dependent monooxygenase [Paenibacillus sp. XY044]OZB90669.1 monooxygenase [Paenibacillus sp. XY044]